MKDIIASGELSVGIGLLVVVLSTFFSAVSSAASWRSVKRRAEANASSIYLTIRERYHRDEMRTSIKNLVEIALPVQQQVGKQWDKLIAAGRAAEIGRRITEGNAGYNESAEAAVRLVGSYFDDVGFLLKHRLVSRRIACSMINVPGINIYYEVCVPIRQYKNPSSPSIEYANKLRSILPKYGKGLVQY